jgi:hypothetical protein
MNKLIIVLMAAVLVAGCPSQPISFNQGGGTNVAGADIMVATNEPTIPSSPAAGTDFTARFTVKNQQTAEKALNAGVWIYDTGKCKLDKIGGLPTQSIGGIWPALVIVTNSGTQYVSDFAPGQQELVRLDMTAPSSNDIAGLSYSCPIRYLINYSFTAKSSVTVDVMSHDRLNQIETQTGERPVYTRTLNEGAGPIRIQMEPTSPMPIENGGKLSMEITLTNEGTGEYPSVLPGQLTMKLPMEFKPVLDSQGKLCGGYFETGAEANNIVNYTNYRKIDLVQNKANPITCEFTVPSSVTVEQEHVISAELPYSYGYFGTEIDAPITP